MLKAIDESGDLGMKLGKGSTPLFSLGAVIFADPTEASRCNSHIASLRKQLHLPEDFEFRFSSTKDSIRERFLKEIAVFSFEYFVATLNKNGLRHDDAYLDKSNLWQAAARRLLAMTRSSILEAEVLIDSMSDRNMNRMMAKFLKHEAGERDGLPLIREVKALKSHKHNLIQLADMVTGAVVRSDSERFRSIIKKREKLVEIWP